MRKISLLSFLLAAFPLAAEAGFGSVKLLRGKATLDGKELHEGDAVNAGEVVGTGERSMVRILLESGVAMQIGPASEVRLEEEKKIPVADLLRGELLSSIRKGSGELKYRVRSKSVSMGVRGTTFFVKTSSRGRTFLCVCEGKVEVKWKGGEQVLVSKHHDAPEMIVEDQAKPEAAAMGHEHSDEDAAALGALLR